MPTLTPKKNKPVMISPHHNIGGSSNLTLPNLTPTNNGNNGSHSSKNGTNGEQGNGNSKVQQQQQRMKYLDSLRGLLAIVVVLHHYRCGFLPCHVFGASASWLSDVTICEDIDTSWNVFLNPFFNGTYCVAVFFCMSALVLAHGLWKAPQETWRVAVAKRYLRLALPTAAALCFSYLLTGINTAHLDAALITKSVWLEKFAMARPSPVTGLLSQLGWGVTLHGSTTLNNSLWTMKVEFVGSLLVFMLVPLLKGSPHRVRSRCLGALFFVLLLPSSQRWSGHLEAKVTYNSIVAVGQPGKKQTTRLTQRVVALDPVKHAHILHEMNLVVNTGNNKETSLLPLTYTEAPPDPWYLKKDVVEADVIVLDKPKLAVHGISNANVVRELKGAADPSNKDYSTPTVELISVTGWKSDNPWLWYATFVGGAWISEYALSAKSSLSTTAASSSSSLAMGVGGVEQLVGPAKHLLLLAAFVCASYPMTPIQTDETINWRIMSIIAKAFGLGSVAYFVWCILGAVALVYYIVVQSELLRKALVAHPILPWLGQLSFSLYLTHIPILYTLTCALFLQLYPVLDESVELAGALALILSLPVMIGVAHLFQIHVDEPSIFWSQLWGRRLLGLSESHPPRGYSKQQGDGSSGMAGGAVAVVEDLSETAQEA